jgi:hypothetical protein
MLLIVQSELGEAAQARGEADGMGISSTCVVENAGIGVAEICSLARAGNECLF